MGKPTLHLRSEDKPMERRSALTPTTAKELIREGFTVNVEKRHSDKGEDSRRIFADEEFEKIGANMVPTGSWVGAPQDHFIIGLKELPEEDRFPLKHTHITFAHSFKQQDGWQDSLSRFSRGNGTLYDLEFLQDGHGRRVAAFGYHAGYAGAALALLAWSHQVSHPDTPFPGVKPYPDEDALIQEVKEEVGKAQRAAGKPPTVLVIGAKGRCGGGAVDMCRKVGVEDSAILKWDMAETAKGGPFEEVITSDIFVNCIYLMSKIPPFVTRDMLESSSRKLRVVCDVSCDPNSPNNPVPIYNKSTTFQHPLLSIPVKNDPPLSMIAIDHLPSLLPREASEAFSNDLLPSLKELHQHDTVGPWPGAKRIFEEKLNELPASAR